jgi:hypothetical protein
MTFVNTRPRSGRWRRPLCAGLILAAVTTAGCGSSVLPDPAPQLQIAKTLRTQGGSEKAVAATTQPQGTGWGTLKGVFKLAGGAPAAGFLATGKDVEVCGARVPNETLEVDGSTQGIRNIVIYCRKASRVFDEYKKAEGKAHEFDQKKCIFLTHVLAIEKKDTLVIKNSDPISHNTNLSPPGNNGINPVLAAGDKIDYHFTRQLVTPTEVTCNIHPWMKAYLMARDDPYFAVTAADGTFEIANLPAGEELEFQVWHEKTPAGLEAVKGWSRGRFRKTLTDGKTEDLQTIEVPASLFQ